ncbi:dienelactone hydrolase family protein [Embleya scabrispora]|uniref:dienelactone hydrolase family protein n=1 Tax=Embleya scabrispora TaxID=159449 RepID=UPI000370A33A|nr:dienelactone hydrolase family protein [Embleya scabrispora]MYS80566.1 prolyl oligopeptidase family serine peptidase [Streptomyces sp. SID5474]
MSEQWITVPTADGPMRAFTVRPAAATAHAGAVVVVQEAFGVNEHIRTVARRIAEHGYLAVAPDLFHRSGVAELPYDRHTDAMGLIGAIGPDAVAVDIGALLAHLAEHEEVPAARTAIVGFCFGGRAAFTAATCCPGLAGVAVFYGPGIAAGPHAVLDRAARIDAPLLLHTGGLDPTIPAEQAAAIGATLTGAGVAFEQYTYPGVGHAFACDARPDKYAPDAAATAWTRTYDFLARVLPGDAG